MKTVFVIVFIIILFILVIILRQKSDLSTLKSKLKKQIKNIQYYNSLSEHTCQVPYPVYYLNMDKDIDRKNAIETQLKKISNNFTRIPGFNGYQIKNLFHDIVDGLGFYNFYQDMTKSEIGCTISHILAIEKARKDNAWVAMICEDDISFDTCSLAVPVETIATRAPPDWEILQLTSIGGNMEKIYKSIKSPWELRYIKRKKPENAFWGGACYLINRKGMDKILSVTSQNPGEVFIGPKTPNFPLFGQADEFIFDLVVTYAVLPCQFFVNNTDLESTIHTDHTRGHILNSLLIVSKFLPNDSQV